MSKANTMEDPSTPHMDDGPIMILLKRLIKNKQNTVMTNTQIIDILKMEFNIDVDNQHELEVDIYIKIIKKFLKDWPQWEELERVSSRLNSLKDYEAVSKVLQHKYKNLKEYLGVMLEAAKPLAKETIDNLDAEVPASSSVSNVVLDIKCTRDKLNNLIVRSPPIGAISSLNVFNKTLHQSSKISCGVFPLDDILNLWCFRIGIFSNTIWFIRDVLFSYEHVLVNKARKQYTERPKPLEQGWMMQSSSIKKLKLSRKEVLKEIRSIAVTRHSLDSELVSTVFAIMKRDLDSAPEYLKLAAQYRKYRNKYKYVRYLSVDNNKPSDYDLHLEETASPAVNFCIYKYCKNQPLKVSDNNWLVIECLLCELKFSGGEDVKDKVIDHFNDNHRYNEKDWSCTNCKTVFTQRMLADTHWSHTCSNRSNLK